jgi:glutamyl-tRNA synthetase
LFKQLGYTPPQYYHTPLLTDKIGRRLSKRDRDLDMGALQQHTSAEKLVGFLAYTAGLIERPEAVSARELIGEFSWDKIGSDDKMVESFLPKIL